MGGPFFARKTCGKTSGQPDRTNAGKSQKAMRALGQWDMGQTQGKSKTAKAKIQVKAVHYV